MVVSYTNNLANLKGFGTFWKLLFRWRGSVYKMVWKDMLVYILLYASLSCTYRFGLTEDQKRDFEKVSQHCGHFRNLIPISFVLGFYVSLVVSRWWGMYLSIPWPDTCCILLSTHVKGQDAIGRMLRCSVVRYLNLAFVMTFAMVAPGVKKNFPTLQQLVDAGYLTANEREILENMDKKTAVHKTWVPFMWACKTVERARREGRVKDDVTQKTLTDEIIRLRGCCGDILGWDEYNIPLVYTQVVTIAVYSFFLFSVIGEQFLDPMHTEQIVDLYVPVFTLLQFFFYIGWLKVAESLINPFGEDDHDFEFVALVKRHLEMSYLLADPQADEHPTMLQDEYWSSVEEKAEVANAGVYLANHSFSMAAEVVEV
ncbi:bestrophin-2-like isoform X1 [Penaeus japonicus]|uniref:bestrophin-2-like isoform X1 n=2 Tax=Penaeus japonicus TaxID=27405 RepID=UPI001C710075|nr:bestrophin-2-like isoform X1 [Penaeus japonicus]XP_042862669.1 bestrophin-2-like isoform X1 [Penaeus japonicus]XP_042862670.1 bestrophin-2-like isoform X1 [Penaeus japonicus]XP_042862671.1 bestrophin-2-like isoform X1 [Penaeus japonicus]